MDTQFSWLECAELKTVVTIIRRSLSVGGLLQLEMQQTKIVF